MKKRKRIYKRYLLLIALAALPFYKFYHEDDYCFGDADLLIMSGYIILFIIAFLVVLFNNLYGISLKKELFNFRPILILVIFVGALLFCFENHTKNYLKKEQHSFTAISEFKEVQLYLYKDATFQVDKTFSNYKCFYKGSYVFTGDTLILNANNTIENLDMQYTFDKEKKVLVSIKTKKPFFEEIHK